MQTVPDTIKQKTWPSMKGLRNRVKAQYLAWSLVFALSFWSCVPDDLPEPVAPPVPTCVDPIDSRAEYFQRLDVDPNTGKRRGQLVWEVDLCDNISKLDFHFGSTSSNSWCDADNLVCIDLEDDDGNIIRRVHSGQGPQASLTLQWSDATRIKRVKVLFRVWAEGDDFVTGKIARLVMTWFDVNGNKVDEELIEWTI